MSEKRPLTPAISRATTILDVVATHDDATLGAIAARSGLAKSSVLDLSRAMVDAGLLDRDDAGGFSLGRRLADIVASSLQAYASLEAFALANLSDFGLDDHTVSLGTLEGAEVVTVDVRYGTQPLPITPRPGQRNDVSDCAAGPAILSALGSEQWAKQLARFAAHHPENAGREHTIQQLLTTTPVAAWRSRTGTLQLACIVPSNGHPALAALTLHVPSDPTSRLNLGQLGARLNDFAGHLGNANAQQDRDGIV